MKYIILLMSVTLLYSCKSTKKLQTSTETKEEKTTLNTDSIVKSKVDSVRNFYEEKLKSLDADIIFDTDCDTMWIDTGSTRTNVANTIKYVPGKGFEASGAIKQFKLKESELIKTIDDLFVQKEEEINLRIKAEDALKEEKKQRSLDKKTVVLSLWWLFFVGYIVGFLYPPKKVVALFKSLLRKPI